MAAELEKKIFNDYLILLGFHSLYLNLTSQYPIESLTNAKRYR